MHRLILLSLLILITGPVRAGGAVTLAELGEHLFFDENLSANRTQSCATCHAPETGFADPAGGAASRGDDGLSLGARNAPSAGYASHVPAFHQTKDGQWAGGLFWNGRASSLEDQAGGPPLNPIEMGMPDKAAVIARIAENPEHVQSFEALFGAGILSRTEAAYTAMTQAIAAFERSGIFAPFDSKYDRYLRGEATFSREEELGRVLFFSQQFTNCNLCHQLGRSETDPRETFSNHQYFNIGVPENTALRSENGVPAGTVDEGLLANPAVTDPAQRGKFRVPALRNVAVTGPYMHNGVFTDLRTVILFYNKYNSRAAARQINPETGAPFGPAPVPETLALAELREGPALDDQRIDALVAFLKTLTDRRYEPLLD